MTVPITDLTAVRATIDADVVAGPDGAVTGDALVADASVATHFVTNASPLPVRAGVAYLFRAQVRAGARTKARLSLAGPMFPSLSRADFDLDAGTVAEIAAGASSASIRAAADGWWTLSVTARATDTGNAWAELYAMDAVEGHAFAGDGVTADIYFTGLEVAGISIREQALGGLKVALEGIADVPGLQVLRNEDTAVERFPTLVLVDAESAQRVIERADGIAVYAVDVTIEGYVSASAPADTGPALSDLYAHAWQAARAAEGSVPEIFEVLEGEMETALVREDGVAPHAFFALEVEVRFGAVPDDPFIAA